MEEGNFHSVLSLDTELKATIECWEKENWPFPEMSPPTDCALWSVQLWNHSDKKKNTHRNIKLIKKKDETGGSMGGVRWQVAGKGCRKKRKKKEIWFDFSQNIKMTTISRLLVTVILWINLDRLYIFIPTWTWYVMVTILEKEESGRKKEREWLST